MAGEKDWVTGGLGVLLDAGSHVDRVTNQRELQLARAADGARDHHTGVDPNADPQLPAKPLGHKAMNHHRGTYRRIGMIGEVIRRAEDGECAIAEELVHMPADV